MRLHLGCNDTILTGWLNVDICEPPPGATALNYRRVDLRPQTALQRVRPDMQNGGWEATEQRWPWDDNTITEIRAWDVFEHIDGPGYEGNKGIIWCLNEAHRVLVPGGKLDLRVPCLPGEAPFVDPTHCQVWTASHRFYFDERWNNQEGERGRLGPAYGITALFRTVGGHSGPDWKPIAYAADAPERRKLMLILEAVK